MKKFENEQKYRIADPERIRKKLKELRARKLFSGDEINEIYDSGGRLFAQRSLLRLRRYGKSAGALLTFKGPCLRGKHKRRREIEMTVPWQVCRVLLRELGFQKRTAYRKYREEYFLQGLHVTLDRIRGAGWFAEIEGTDREIQRTAGLLGLGAAQEEVRNYLEIFLTVQ